MRVILFNNTANQESKTEDQMRQAQVDEPSEETQEKKPILEFGSAAHQESLSAVESDFDLGEVGEAILGNLNARTAHLKHVKALAKAEK